MDAFALVGTMSYQKGTFAFFDGTSPEYRKVLERDGAIAGYKVAEITPNAVKLEAANKRVEMKVGTQMRHEGERLADECARRITRGGDGRLGVERVIEQRRQRLRWRGERCPEETYATERTGVEMNTSLLRILSLACAFGLLASVYAQQASPTEGENNAPLAQDQSPSPEAPDETESTPPESSPSPQAVEETAAPQTNDVAASQQPEHGQPFRLPSTAGGATSCA